MSQPKPNQPVALKIRDTNGTFLLDTNVTTEEGAKLMVYAMQMINYRAELEKKQAELTEEDQIDLAIKEIKKS